MFSSSSHQIGASREEAVEKALENIKAKGEILSYIRSAKNSNLDRQGADFVAVLPCSRQVAFQVKSSENHRIKFERRRLYKHLYFIPAIVVHAWDMIGQIIDKVKKAIQLALHKIQCEINRTQAINRRKSEKRLRYVNHRRQRLATMCH